MVLNSLYLVTKVLNLLVPLTESASQPTSHLVSQSASHSQSIGKSVNQPVSPSVGQSFNPSVSQSASLSVRRSACRPVCQPHHVPSQLPAQSGTCCRTGGCPADRPPWRVLGSHCAVVWLSGCTYCCKANFVKSLNKPRTNTSASYTYICFVMPPAIHVKLRPM